MSYRPKGWKGYRRTIHNAYNTNAEDFEAGAESLLKALKKESIQVFELPHGTKMHIILIPEE